LLLGFPSVLYRMNETSYDQHDDECRCQIAEYMF